ncbi:BCCT family transporter [Photobacterium sp. WH77]|uniref:BCCT family transporter n=1 Tax=unclassified Photobacterium TaxID=2628852 RepID=UPI001EDA5BB2|nr:MULTISPECIES: BCCT family transporter [unclassified Photobacterium]MCG2838739.1 BCCT family transporter [Photobacterium sp. WH77]MCG2846340.1 BCCT family transporter [Photobacterium sp. WH80]
MRATSGILKGLNPTVTIASKVVVIGFVLFCAILANQAGQYFETISSILLQNMKWFYIGLVSLVVGFLIYLMISRYGHIRLGKDNEKPEFSYLSWVSMLFSGGMGIGLIFWSVAEPMWHYADNPFTEGLTNQSAATSMQLTFFHWGLHPWSVFIIVALALAYFSYRKDLPFTLRSILYPLIGNRIYGPIGHTVDILTVAVTAFGISQTLGMGVIQINSGLNQAFGIDISLGTQLVIIVTLCTCAVASVLSGIGKGIRRLSEWNMLLSLLLVVIVLYIGPTRYILNTLLESTGAYAQNIIGMSLWSDAQNDSGWQNWWTAYYWPWWMTWAPFVGMFVARISKGRTIRELIGGALIVPTLITFLWISVFGGAALKVEQDARIAHQEQTVVAAAQQTNQTPSTAFTGGPILDATKADTTRALFTLFDNLDTGLFGKLLSVLACVLLGTYFITSADSGTLVLCTLDAAGDSEPPTLIRILWGIMIAVIAAVLLYAGGLKAMQTASIIAGFPIAIFIAVMSMTLFHCLRREPKPWAMLPEHVHPEQEKLDGPVEPLVEPKSPLKTDTTPAAQSEGTTHQKPLLS